MGVRAICWDWNGTLLDDVARCLRTMNSMLMAFGKPIIADAQQYRALFRFPIQSFYASAGIEVGEYRAAVDHYLELLASDDSSVPLHPGAREVIAQARACGIRQVLASATQAPLLAAQMRPHRLNDAFDEILSITDAHAASKREVIDEWLARSALRSQEVLLVGDTNHDQEIALDLGTQFVHFAGGHQALTLDPATPQITALVQLSQFLGIGPTKEDLG